MPLRAVSVFLSCCHRSLTLWQSIIPSMRLLENWHQIQIQWTGDKRFCLEEKCRPDTSSWLCFQAMSTSHLMQLHTSVLWLLSLLTAILTTALPLAVNQQSQHSSLIQYSKWGSSPADPSSDWTISNYGNNAWVIEAILCSSAYLFAVLQCWVGCPSSLYKSWEVLIKLKLSLLYTLEWKCEEQSSCHRRRIQKALKSAVFRATRRLKCDILSCRFWSAAEVCSL